MSDDTAASTATASESVAAAPSAVVSAIGKFVAAEGGSAKAVVQPAGAAGVRITLVGEAGGILGDQVVDSVRTADAVIEAVDGLERAEWDRDLTSVTEVKPSHWRQMAGWVAHQSRFPKARNRKILD
ncbi:MULTISPECIES: hypothetical protein [Gordonia]|uniref:Uncharacterized protein n=2 Tax=Gordonia TaxID=2053 RepID=L7LFU4_9ACTN|nr:MULTISPECIES: hypothetical protein [Gordonia]AUH69071.1 hypothetical protein CXX93_12865 [Gordonia sp. YC-JH1]KJR06597.1 hypothetical protein UG54_13325 [Gordonia sihwensis]KXT56848.1 hypothetical protein Y710_11640 [Gordonia sp. QH-12]MBY4568620.1 hypothetical protein [Gordonia sihwensis]WFN94654.1 hypothetical protein P5P27_09070 [Gordonia sihwensis]